MWLNLWAFELSLYLSGQTAPPGMSFRSASVCQVNPHTNHLTMKMQQNDPFQDFPENPLPFTYSIQQTHLEGQSQNQTGVHSYVTHSVIISCKS